MGGGGAQDRTGPKIQRLQLPFENAARRIPSQEVGARPRKRESLRARMMQAGGLDIAGDGGEGVCVGFPIFFVFAKISFSSSLFPRLRAVTPGRAVLERDFPQLINK